jgi:hypothetical protein
MGEFFYSWTFFIIGGVLIVGLIVLLLVLRSRGEED